MVRQTGGQTDEWIDEGKSGRIDGWKDVYISVWRAGWAYGWTDGQMNEKKTEPGDRWMESLYGSQRFYLTWCVSR